MYIKGNKRGNNMEENRKLNHDNKGHNNNREGEREIGILQPQDNFKCMTMVHSGYMHILIQI